MPHSPAPFRTGSDMGRSAGRPRAFDADAVLRAARDLFWRNGYEQTSLEQLIAAMGISRSSFYACFGSKHATLIRALTLYSAESLARVHAAIRTEAEPAAQLGAALATLADVTGGRRGCFLANCLSEFGSHDTEVERIVQAQLASIERALSGPLTEMARPDPAADARLLVTVVLGLIALRKAGFAPEALQDVLSRAKDTVL